MRDSTSLLNRLAALAALVLWAQASCAVDARTLQRKASASTGSSPQGGGAGEGSSEAGEGGGPANAANGGADAGAAAQPVAGEAGVVGEAGAPVGGSAGASQSGAGGTGGSGGSGGTSGQGGSAGSGGEPFVSPCGDLNQNLRDDCEETLVANSRFDSVATSWIADPNVQQAWSMTNGTGGTASGSLSIINANVVDGLSGSTAAGSRQCLAGFGKEVFELAARFYLRESQGEGRASIGLAIYGHDNCDGTFLKSVTLDPAVTIGSWQVIHDTVEMPAAARSFWVRLLVSKPLKQPAFEALVDDVLVAKREKP